MNAKSLAMTAGIGLLYLLLGSSLFLQWRQSNPLSIENVKLALQQGLSPLEKQLGLLEQEIDEMKKEVTPSTERAATSNTQIEDLKKDLAKTNTQIEDLAKKVDDVHTELFASSKSIGALAKHPVSGSRLSEFLGNVDSDPELKLEFSNAVQSVLPQKKWGKLFVTNESRFPRELFVDTGREERPIIVLQHAGVAGSGVPIHSVTLPVGSIVGHLGDPSLRHKIEAPDFELHYTITRSGFLLRSQK